MSGPKALDLLPTEFESEVRASVGGVLRTWCAARDVTALYDGDRSVVDPLWRRLAVDLALGGLLIPEAHGGSGPAFRESAAVMEELGRFVAPAPFLSSAVIATSALVGPAITGSAAGLLEGLAAGERTAALLVPLSLGPRDAPPLLTRDPLGRVSGRVTSVAGTREADTLLALVESDAGPALAAIEASAATVTPVVSFDMSRPVADIRVDGAAVTVVRPDGREAVRRALLVGAAMLASEQVGVARWCLETTVAHLKVRTQFGRVVGGYQALKHRLADLYAEVEAASAAAVNAAAALAADDPDADLAASVAQSVCSDVAVHAAEEAVQLHGGIGMTWEYPVHLYLKRAKADQIGLGTPGAHRAHLATLVDLPAPEVSDHGWRADVQS